MEKRRGWPEERTVGDAGIGERKRGMRSSKYKEREWKRG